MERPLLLYNLFAPGSGQAAGRGAVQVLREEEEPLSRALADQGDDLTPNCWLPTRSIRTGRPRILAFWRGAPASQDGRLRHAPGRSGLASRARERPPASPESQRGIRTARGFLGTFDDEVMLLLDTYPDVNWPLMAEEFVSDQEITRRSGQEGDRYKPGIDELEGDAARIIRQAGKTGEVERRRKTWTSVPALAFSGPTMDLCA